MDTLDTQFCGDKNTDGSQNVGLFALQPPDVAGRLNEFYCIQPPCKLQIIQYTPLPSITPTTTTLHAPLLHTFNSNHTSADDAGNEKTHTTNFEPIKNLDSKADTLPQQRLTK
jgi:hypothetical protein